MVLISVVAAFSPKFGFSLLHIVLPRGKYELSCDKEHPALFSKAGFLRVHNIHYVDFVRGIFADMSKLSRVC